MGRDTVTVRPELTVREAKALFDADRPTDHEAAASAHEKLRAALAASERDERAERLGLPWEAFQHNTEQSNGWCVRDRHDLRGVSLGATEAQVRLRAAAPDLAKALEHFVRDADISGRQGSLVTESRAALKKSGWLK